MNSKKGFLILITLVTTGVLLPLLAKPVPVQGERSEKTSFLTPEQTMDGGSVFLPALSMPPIEQWVRNYSVSGNEYSALINQMAFAPNGDIVWIGQGSDGQASDALMGRMQNDGELLWLKGYGNGNSYHDSFSTLIPAADGGYWVGGGTRVDDLQKNYPWLLRINEAGILVWQKIVTIPTPSPYGAEIDQMVETDDGSLVLVINDFYSGVWITKLTGTGEVIWVRMYGETTDPHALWDIDISNDGNYILSGNTYVDTDFYDYLTWIVKMSSSGSILWQRTYSLTQAAISEQDAPFGLEVMSDGSYIVGIQTELLIQGQPERSFWFIRLNSAGDVIWQKAFSSSTHDLAYMTLAPDESIVVTGREPFTGNARPWVFRLSSSGALSWRRFYGGINDFLWPAAPYAVQVSEAGDIYIGGSESYQYEAGLMLLRLNSQGTVPECNLFTDVPLTSTVPGYTVSITNAIEQPTTLSVTNISIPTWDLTGQTIEICPGVETNIACDLPE